MIGCKVRSSRPSGLVRLIRISAAPGQRERVPQTAERGPACGVELGRSWPVVCDRGHRLLLVQCRGVPFSSSSAPVTGDGQEDLVQAGPAQRELGDARCRPVVELADDGGAGPRRATGAVATPVSASVTTSASISAASARSTSASRVRVGRRAPCRTWPPILRLQLVRGAGGDDPALVDDDDLVGELVGLVQVLGGQQHRDAVGDQRRAPRPTPRSRLRGSSPVVGSSRKSTSGVPTRLAARSRRRRMPPE